MEFWQKHCYKGETIMATAKRCKVENCDGKYKGLGYCNRHYQQFKIHGAIQKDTPEEGLFCSVFGCRKKHHAKGLCDKHYRQLERHGKLLERTIYDPNEIITNGDVSRIQLYDKDGVRIAETIIDTIDVPLIFDKKWYLYKGQRYNYAASKAILPQLYLHKFLMNPDDGMDVDHADHDTLNNRRYNLRVCTRSQNQYNSIIPITNTSGAKCVCWDKTHKLWVVRIKVDTIPKQIGYFKTFAEAEAAATSARRDLHGDYAHNG